MEILSIIGAFVGLIGWIWAIVNGFQQSGAMWGVLNIIPFQPLIGIISAGLKKISWPPVILMLVGTVISILGNASAVFN